LAAPFFGGQSFVGRQRIAGGLLVCKRCFAHGIDILFSSCAINGAVKDGFPGVGKKVC